jgi:GntR family transcriptional regulator
MKECLNKTSVTPLYQQLAERIRQAVQEGVYREGEKIPSEQELIARYDVSRVTVRKAMQALLEKGLIIRQQGRGTFIRQKVVSQEMDEIFGLYPSLVKKGLNPRIKILSYEIVSPDFEVRENLRLPREEKTLKIVRLYSLRETPLLVSQIYIPQPLAANWTRDQAAAKNSFRLLEENAGIVIHGSRVRIMAGPATPQMGKWLGLPRGGPLLQVRRLTFSGAGPVEYTIFSFRGDAYEISTKIYAGQKNGLILLETGTGPGP